MTTFIRALAIVALLALGAFGSEAHAGCSPFAGMKIKLQVRTDPPTIAPQPTVVGDFKYGVVCQAPADALPNVAPVPVGGFPPFTAMPDAGTPGGATTAIFTGTTTTSVDREHNLGGTGSLAGFSPPYGPTAPPAVTGWIGPLPCTTTQLERPAAPAGFQWKTTLIPSQTVPVTVNFTCFDFLGCNEPINTATFLNELVQAASTGTITVSKTITGAPMGYTPSTSFGVYARCNLPAANTRYPATGTVAVTATSPGVIPDIPAGATCTVVEDTAAVPAPPAGYGWRPAVYTQPVGTVPSGGNLTASVQNVLAPMAPQVCTNDGFMIQGTIAVPASGIVDSVRLYKFGLSGAAYPPVASSIASSTQFPDNPILLTITAALNKDGYFYSLPDYTASNVPPPGSPIATNVLYRYDTTGAFVSLGVVGGLPSTLRFNSMTADANGDLWVMEILPAADTTTPRRVFKITGSLTGAPMATEVAAFSPVTLSSTAGDIAYNPVDGKIYSIQAGISGTWSPGGGPRVAVYDPVGNTWSLVGQVTTGWPAGLTGGFGSNFFDRNGRYYAFHNGNSRQLYNIDLATLTAGPALLTGLLAGNTNTDAASCPLPMVDLRLTKSGPATLTPGATAAYSFLVENVGPGATAVAVNVTDILPTGLSFATTPTFTNNGWTCTVSTTTNTNDTASCSSASSIAALTGSSTFTADVLVASTVTTSPLINKAKVWGGADVGKPTETTTGSIAACDQPSETTSGSGANAGCAYESTPLTPQVNVTKAVNPVGRLDPNGAVSYTVVASNTGAVAANGTTLSDALPVGIASASWTCVATSGGSTINPLSGSGALSTTLNVFPAGAVVTCTINATVAASPPATIANTASVTPPVGGLCYSGNATPPQNTAPPCEASVSNGTTAAISGRVYREAGGNTADNGPGTDPGLSGVTISVSCAAPNAFGPVTTTTAGDGSYSVAGVPVGAACTLTETQPVGYTNAYNTQGTGGTGSGGDTAGSSTNSTLSLTVPAGGSTGNNFAEQSTNTTSAVACTPSPANVGDTIACTVTCTNNGPGTAVNMGCAVTNTAALPAGATVTCAPNANVSATAPNNTLTCSVGFTLPGTSVTINAGSSANNDTIGGSVPTSGDNPSTITLTAQLADMSPSYSGIPAVMSPGEVVTGIRLTCTNNGPGTASVASCVPSVNVGTIGSISCTPTPPATIAVGASIECSFSYTAPGTPGGGNEPLTGLTFTGTTGATNDSNGGTTTGGNNTTTVPVAIIDAIDDPVSTVGSTTGGTTASVLGNDTTGTSAATTGNATLTPGTAPTPAAGSITMNADGTITVAPNTTPGTYQYPYTICANPATTPVACDTAVATVVIVGAPALSLTKTAAKPTVALGVNANQTDAGDTVTYSFSVTNTGNVALTNVTLSDAKLPTLACDVIATLAVGQTLPVTNCTGNVYTLTAADVTASTTTNVATTTGVAPDNTCASAPCNITSTGSATVPATPTNGLTLTKLATPGVYSAAGDTISYTILVENTGTIALTAVAVTDPLAGTVTCPSGNPIPSLAVNESATCTASYSISAADVTAKSMTNVATANGIAPPNSCAVPPCNVTGSDSVTVVTASPIPQLSVVKQASPTTIATVGQTIDYTIVTTNTGNVALTNVTVVDAKVPALSCVPSTSPTPVASLAVGASIVCTGPYTVTAADITESSVTNTAIAVGTPPTGLPVTGTATSTTPVVPVANDDFYVTPLNTPVANPISVNDQYPVGSTATVPTTSTSGGTIVCTPASPTTTPANCTYTPPPGFTGTDTYTYTLCLAAPNGDVCDTAIVTIVVSATDMSPAFSGIPAALAPGQVVNNATLTCTNAATGVAALAATCVPTVDVGSISNVVCTPATPAASLASGAAIVCTFTYTAPGSAGGTDTVPTGVLFTGTTGASNDSNGGVTTGGNNQTTQPATLIDAVNDAATTVGSSSGGTTPSVLLNDTIGTTPATTATPANVTLTPGTAPTPAAGSITMNADGTITVAPNTTPGTYQYPYTICVNPATTPAACDTATATVVVSGLPDVITTLSVPSAPVQVGTIATVGVSFGNIGPVPAANVVVTLQLPVGLTGVTPSNGGIYNPTSGVVTWPAIASIAANTPNAGGFTVSFTMPAVSSLTATSTATVPGGETTTGNNPSTGVISNAATEPTPVPTLSAVMAWLMMALLILTAGFLASKRRGR